MLDHIGALRLHRGSAEDDAKIMSVWKEGIAALAAHGWPAVLALLLDATDTVRPADVVAQLGADPEVGVREVVLSCWIPMAQWGSFKAQQKLHSKAVFHAVH